MVGGVLAGYGPSVIPGDVTENGLNPSHASDVPERTAPVMKTGFKNGNTNAIDTPQGKKELTEQDELRELLCANIKCTRCDKDLDHSQFQFCQECKICPSYISTKIFSPKDKLDT